MSKTLTEMAVEIASAQASHTGMSAEEMQEFIRKTFETLQGIKESEEGTTPSGAKGEEADVSTWLADLRANPSKSIKPTYVINLEDGKKYKVLTSRTLRKFGLTPKEYRAKWGFSPRQPLSSKKLTSQRRKTAKELRLGERLQEARQAKKAGTKKAASSPKKETKAKKEAKAK